MKSQLLQSCQGCVPSTVHTPSPFPAGVTMPAVVIFNREKIVVMGGCGITIYRDFYAFAATLWAKNLLLLPFPRIFATAGLS